MPISFIGQASAVADNVAIPAHVADDLIVIFAYRSASTVTPTVPAGFTTINSGSANTNGHALAWKIATSSSETSGTWTNAEGIIAHVYRGASGIGGQAQATNIVDPAAFPGITMTVTDGTSWVAGFIGTRGRTSTVNNSPTGMVNRASVTLTSGSVGSDDTNGGVSSWTGANMTLTPAGNRYRIAVVELVATAGPATVTGNAAAVAPILTLTAPVASASGAQVIGTVSGAVSAVAPVLTLSAPVASASGSLTVGTVTGSASATAPILTLSAPVASGTGSQATGTITGTGSAVAPVLTLSAPVVAAMGAFSEGGVVSTPIRTLQLTARAKKISFTARAKRLSFTANVGSNMHGLPQKLPDEIWQISLDCTPWIPTGATMTDFAAVAVSGSVTVSGEDIVDGDTGTFRISGGIVSGFSTVRVLATMSDGQVFGDLFSVPM